MCKNTWDIRYGEHYTTYYNIILHILLQVLDND